MTRVTVWSEYRQERSDPPVAAIYPHGIHAAIAEGLGDAGFEVRTATLDEPEHGLNAAVLAETDVLTWWGHVAHPVVSDAVVDRVQRRVLQGMGLIVLHSGHMSRSLAPSGPSPMMVHVALTPRSRSVASMAGSSSTPF